MKSATVRGGPLVSSGDEAGQSLLPELYDRLRELASGFLSGEAAGHTLQPTALVHEAYLRLIGQTSVGFRDRLEFLGVAALLMRRILVDHARRRRALKRRPVERGPALEEIAFTFEERAFDLLALDEALERLAEWDPRKSRIVELRFFGGMTVEETGRYLELPRRTVEREWTLTRAWLRSEMTGSSRRMEP